MASIINATTTNGVAVQGDNSGSLQLQTNNGTTAVTIDTSQNVGIGTSSPTEKLDVLGNTDTTLRVRATSDTALILNETTPNKTWKVKSSDGTLAFQYSSTAYNSGYSSRMLLDSSGNLSFNSGYGSVATAYGCRAWVNFNGTGTVAIRASGNVTSITDNGTGDYTINFTTAMPNANYAFTQHITCGSTGAVNDGCDLQSIATGSFRVLCGNGGTPLDADYAMFSIFR